MPVSSMMISVDIWSPRRRDELTPVARLNCTFGAPVAAAKPHDVIRGEGHRLHLGAVDGSEPSLGLVAHAPDEGAVAAGERCGQDLAEAMQVDRARGAGG